MPSLSDICMQMALGWFIGFVVSASLVVPLAANRLLKQFIGCGADIRC